MTVRCLAKKRKVGVKNKENETACFIEIEGLLNSPELISDLPGLGLGARGAREESWRRQGSPRQVGAACDHGPAAGTAEAKVLEGEMASISFLPHR